MEHFSWQSRNTAAKTRICTRIAPFGWNFVQTFSRKPKPDPARREGFGGFFLPTPGVAVRCWPAVPRAPIPKRRNVRRPSAPSDFHRLRRVNERATDDDLGHQGTACRARILGDDEASGFVDPGRSGGTVGTRCRVPACGSACRLRRPLRLPADGRAGEAPGGHARGRARAAAAGGAARSRRMRSAGEGSGSR